MTDTKDHKYDVALSFAGEQRSYVDEVAKILKENNVEVFYDNYETVDLWGKDLYTHLDEIYQFKSKYCVMFLSKDYAKKAWTNHERQSAQARAFQENREYILPVKFDDTEIPGVRKTVGYIDANSYSPRELGVLIMKKLGISIGDDIKVYKGEVVDLTSMCISFPEISACNNDSLSDSYIWRDNIITTIDKMFDTGVQVIGVEGEEGIGKTTLLVQYARRHSDNVFSSFVKSTSKWGFDPMTLQYDLCNQLNWFFYKKPIESPDIANDTFFRSHILKLQQQSRIYKQKFIFVIDGLEDIPSDAINNREQIIDMLPLGTNNFKFLLSTDPNILPDHKRKGLSYKPFQLVEFIYSEVENFFYDISIPKEYLQEIYNTCKGIPGKLSSVKRILKSGVDIETFISDMHNKIPNLFEMEWNNVANKGEFLEKIFALLAHDNNTHNVKFLSKIFNVDEAEILKVLNRASFICIDKESSEISFVSNGFRNFVADKLSHYKEQVNQLIIEYLIEIPESEENLKYLPKYLVKAGRHNEVIQYLSPDRFDEMFKKIPSINVIEQMVDLGIEVSDRLGYDGDIVRFSLHKSILAGFKENEIWKSEIEALMALKDYESAMTLAQTTVLKEDRLHLLAIIARKKKEHGLIPEPELLDQIRNLYKQIDLLLPGDKVIDIATDLMFSIPEIAIEIVEKSTSTDLSENSIDWAFASLSIAAIASDSQYMRMDIFKNLNSKISNPVLKKFSTGASVLLGNYSTKEVIAEVEKLENTSERLYLLCEWIKTNRKNESSYEVIDYALKLILKTTAYAPNARVYKNIVSALPFISDVDKIKQIIDILNSQKQTIENSGPTEDYVMLQLLLAESESKFNISLALSRMNDIYLYISYINDFDSKINCLAKYVCVLERIDSENVLKEADEIRNLAKNDLESNIDLLLNSSAEQYDAAKSIIYSLSMCEPDKAFELANKLNTESRRDFAFDKLIESYVELPIEKIDFGFVKMVLDSICDKDIKSIALIKVVERFANSKDIEDNIIDKAIPIINLIGEVQNSSERCRASCLMYFVLKEKSSSDYKGIEEKLLDILKVSWMEIDLLWKKIDVGFKIVEAMAEHSLEIAREYMHLTEELRRVVVFDSTSNALTFNTCIKLAVRAYSGLLPRHINTNKDFERLVVLIESIPSIGEQVTIWSNMALYCYINNSITEFYKIYDNYINPGLNSLKKDDKSYFNQVICGISPVLYKAHKLTAFDVISSLPLSDRDLAYLNMSDFIINKKIPSEPYEEFYNVGKGVNYSDLIDICEILEYIEDDSIIYNIISQIANCIVDNRTLFSREQQNDIIAKVTKIINTKLPNSRFIKHEGYKIISLAQVYRISKPEKEKWDKLVIDSYKIPNSADRSFVLCVLASIMKKLPIDKRKELINNAKGIIDSIPSTIERINHFENLSYLAWEIDPILCKESLKSALNFSLECKEKSVFSVQRRIIDLAYRLDPNLASSLTSITDNDEARSEVKRNIRHRHQLLKYKKSISDQATKHDSIELESPLDYVKVSWMMLKSLNSGRVIPIHIQQTREYVIRTCSLPLIQVYPVYAWLIQNAILRLSHTDQSSTTLRSIFEATLLGAEFAKRITIRTSNINKQTIDFLSKQFNNDSIIIKTGERESAINYINNWMDKNLKGYLKICDPYFGLEELEILKYIRSACPSCRVHILTSIQYLEQEKTPEPWDDAFKNFWRMRISDQDPPDTDIYAIGTQSLGKPPFHDRLWITNGSGLRIGTSLNSLGLSKSSEISVLNQEDASLFDCEIDQYINRTIREHNGERLKYRVFTLI